MKASKRLELLNERQKENAMEEAYNAMMAGMLQQRIEQLKISLAINSVGLFILFCVLAGLLVAMIKSI